MFQKSGSTDRSRATIDSRAADLFEPLEQRMLLYTPTMLSGLPALNLLADPSNTVVRMSTEFGNIDIELFDAAGPSGLAQDAAPNTAANFLNYINDGDFDNTFFHRLVHDFVLQGGGFSHVPGQGVVDVPVDDPIQNEFSSQRLNLERTIAMALRGTNANSATSQFFFNLGNNSGLDVQTQFGGPFAVFGRVIQGWNVVLEIAEFNTVNYSSANPALGEVPVVPTAGTNPPLGNDALVNIIDIEVIKPGGDDEFYTQAYYSPEGYRSNHIVEVIGIGNLDANEATHYQIIARHAGGSRDVVIASGTLAPGARTNITVSDGSDPDLNLVRKFAAYALEIRTTGPIAATLDRFDFGSATSESFINASPLSDPGLTTWTFGSGEIGDGVFPFIVWQNLTLQTANLNVTFLSQTASQAISFTRTVEPARRGGLNLSLLPLPEGAFSVVITSDVPIVAAYSEFRPAANTADDGGSMANGMYNGGGPIGVLPGAMIPSDGTAVIRAQLSTGGVSIVIVDFEFILSDGSLIASSSPLTFAASAPSRTRIYDIPVRNASLPKDEFFSIRYRVRAGSHPMTMHFVSETAGGQVSTPFITSATDTASFGSAFFDPGAGTNLQEVISILNPFSGAGQSLTYRVGFLFADNDNGTADELLYPAAAQGTLDPLNRVDIRISDIAEIVAKIQSDERFRQFSIVVETTDANGDPALAVTQLTRLDFAGGQAITAIGQLGNGILTNIPTGNVVS